MEPKLQEVFKVTGVPTYTFVEPTPFPALKVALDTPGRGVVVEGPSGIGKSTAVTRALESLDLGTSVVKLSARDPRDSDYISLLPELTPFGVVVVDDFHRLTHDDKSRLADLFKTLADREALDSKLILIGINEAGRSLIEVAADITNRIERLKFEVEPEQKVENLIELGEAALNIRFAAREHIARACQGSFYIAQMLSFEMCVINGVLEKADDALVIDTSLSGVVQRVMTRQEARFGESLRNFVRGTRFRPGGRAPYLHILHWLANAENWSISLRDELARHPSERISVGQVVEKGYLARLIDDQGLSELLHYDPVTGVLWLRTPI